MMKEFINIPTARQVTCGYLSQKCRAGSPDPALCIDLLLLAGSGDPALQQIGAQPRQRSAA